MVAPRHGKRWLYGALGVVSLVAVACGAYLLTGAAPVGDTAAVESTPAEVARPRSNARVATAQPFADPAALTQNQIDKATHFVGDARRFAIAGSFAEVDSTLQQADKAAPGLSEIAQARRDIEEMHTPQGQLALAVVKSRSALERGDYDAAGLAVGQAERLDAKAPQVIELRRDLEAALHTDTRKTDRLAALLAAMRTALAQNDFATANQALNEAERIDIQAPAVLKARVELNRAQRKN